MTTRYTAFLLLGVMILAIGALVGCGGPVDMSKFTARELFDKGLAEYEKGKHLRGVNYLQTLVFNYPGVEFIDSAQYYLALSYYGNDDYVLGGVEFNRLLINYPSSEFAQQAQFMRAVCFFEGTPENYGLDQTDLYTAIKQFEDFLIDYPESEVTPDAKKYLNLAHTRLAKKLYESGIVYTRVRDHRAAKVYYQKVVDEYTDTEFAPLATYQLAEAEYKLRNWDDAHEKFQNFAVVFADHELAAKALKRSCEALIEGGKTAFDEA
ncbi:MAG: outer membrane protein assembly factor BamD, partial [candidate division Zixibacteria bacterium]|nr:outer membrane protein assembly factor BamD [candidate division Zixibacteria bacterium]